MFILQQLFVHVCYVFQKAGVLAEAAEGGAGSLTLIVNSHDVFQHQC